MLFLKPIVRTVILSMILASLIIYLGIKYHWSDYLKASKSENVSILKIPAKKNAGDNPNGSIPEATVQDNFIPEILPVKPSDNLISSMNKEQVTHYCKSLVSKSTINNDQLSLLVVNCVVSNYQESHQTINDSNYLKRKQNIYKQCQQKFAHNNQYTNIEKQLLVGICTSDNLTQ